MTPQMFFVVSYVPCVAFYGMSFAIKGKASRLLRKISFIFGGLTICSYIMFIKNIL